MSRMSVEQRWQALRDGEFFFVPSLDAVGDRKKVLSLGYYAGRNPPEVQVGIFKGMHGLLCYRKRTRGRRAKVANNP